MTGTPSAESGVWPTWIRLVIFWFPRSGVFVWRSSALLSAPSRPWTGNDDGLLLRAEFRSFAPFFESDAAENLEIHLHVF